MRARIPAPVPMVEYPRPRPEDIARGILPAEPVAPLGICVGDVLPGIGRVNVVEPHAWLGERIFVGIRSFWTEDVIAILCELPIVSVDFKGGTT